MKSTIIQQQLDNMLKIEGTIICSLMKKLHLYILKCLKTKTTKQDITQTKTKFQNINGFIWTPVLVLKHIKKLCKKGQI